MPQPIQNHKYHNTFYVINWSGCSVPLIVPPRAWQKLPFSERLEFSSNLVRLQSVFHLSTLPPPHEPMRVNRHSSHQTSRTISLVDVRTHGEGGPQHGGTSRRWNAVLCPMTFFSQTFTNDIYETVKTFEGRFPRALNDEYSHRGV